MKYPLRMNRKKPERKIPNPSDFKAAFCRRTYCNPKQIGGIFIGKLIVAEKPSVAMAYAKVLGATNRQDGYWEGNGYLVSWCVGHLVELAPPNIYDAKYVKWSMKIKKLGALLVSAALCAGMAAPAFAFEGEAAPVEQPILPEVMEEDVVTITDETSGALTPEGNLTLVDDYHTNYSDGSGQQFITLVSKSGATFYLVIDRNAKGQQTVHFMNLVDEADLLALMEEEDADAYTAEKEAAVQAEQDRLRAEEEAKKAAEEATASGTEQPKDNKVTKIASGFLGVVVLIALAAGGIFYAFAKQKQKKQAEKEALDPDANYTEDKGDFEIPTEDEPEDTGKEDNTEE